MARWTAFPYTGEFDFDADSVRVQWNRLHKGDMEPLPRNETVLNAWALFHTGEFEKATQTALKAGPAGVTVANKATSIYANYLEKKEKSRLNLFLEVAHRAEVQAELEPGNPNAWYWHAYALGRYSQGISVVKALAQGLGGKVKTSLEKVIQLQPHHADAHVALGAFHAEVIDKVGALIGAMTYGAKKDAGLKSFEDALRMNPGSAIAMIEYANGLAMLEGESRMKEATRLYEQAVATKPMDAAERLDVELARAGLQD